MAEPRKVPFVTISSYNNAPTVPDLPKKRCREAETGFGADGVGSGGLGPRAAAGGEGSFGSETEMDKTKPSVRLILPLSEPNELTSSEFNYRDLLHSTVAQVRKQEVGNVIVYTSSFHLN